MKQWMRQQKAAAAAAAAPSGDTQTDQNPPAPKRTIPTLPDLGVVIFVYGIEHDGRGCAAMVTDVHAETGEVNVTGGRRNGQPFGMTHVLYLAPDETVPTISEAHAYAYAKLTEPKPVTDPVPAAAEPVTETQAA